MKALQIFTTIPKFYGDKASIRQQYLAYRELRSMRDAVPCETSLDGIQEFVGALLRVTAQDLAQLGVIDRVVPEPVGGAQRDPALAADMLASAISEASEVVRAKVPVPRATTMARTTRRQSLTEISR